MQKIKVFIPSYNRAKAITTHKVFLARPDLFEVKIVLNDEAQRDQYLEADPTIAPLILISGKKGLINARQFIFDSVEMGEWFLSADDDMTQILMNKTGWDKTSDESYKYEADNEMFFSKIPELIEKANFEQVNTIGFSIVDNAFFNKNKFTNVGHIMNGMVMWRRTPEIDWCANDFKDAMEEMNITAQQHLFYGKVLRCHYIRPNAQHYQEGGIGILKERKPYKIAESNKLVAYYENFFRPKNDDDVSVAFTDLKQVKMWRLKMIAKGKLDISYAKDILKDSKQLKQFTEKYAPSNSGKQNA